MPLICYVDKSFYASSRRMISQANEILHEYDAQGFVLTLRQLYYQFVARDLIPNNMQSYKRLGSVVNRCASGRSDRLELSGRSDP